MAPSGRVLDVALDGNAPGGPIAWCRVCNLIAVALKPVSHYEAQIVLIEPSDPSAHTRLRVPLGSGVDAAPLQPGAQPTGGVSYMEWSPPGSPRVLLVLTHCGKVCGFRQLQKSSSTVQTINEWHGKPIMTLSSGERLLAIRWVEPQSAWNWPPTRPSSTGQLLSMHSAFLAPRDTLFPKGDVKFTDHVLHWVRPGLLSCVAVMGNGHIRIWSCMTSRQDFHWAERKTSISGIGDSQLVAADAVTGPQQTLRVCTVKQGDSNTVVVSEMRGDPTAESCGKACTKLTVAKVATVNMLPSAMGAALLAVHFDPSKWGRTFLCLLNDQLGSALQIVCYRQKAKTNYEAFATLRFPLSALPQDVSAAARKGLSAFRISNDGCMLAMARGDTPGTIHAVRTSVMERPCETLSLSDGIQETLAATGMAFSPSGTCLAVSAASASGDGRSTPRLQIFSLADFTHLPAPSASGDEKVKDEAWTAAVTAHRSVPQQARLCGERAMWCLLQGHHHWDVAVRLKELAALKLPAIGSREMTGLQVALTLVDETIHCQPHFSRGSISSDWDFVKMAAISSEPLADAQVIFIDLRARIMFCVLESLFKSFYNHEEFQSLMPKSGPRPYLAIDDTQKAVLQMWVDWIADFGEFFVSNLIRWVQKQKQREASQNPADHQNSDSVPCIRLATDQSFIKRLTAAVIFSAVSVPHPQSSSPKRDKLNKTLEVCKRIGAVIQKRAKPLSSADIEKIGGELSCAQAAVASFKGRYHLHYSRTSGGVDWKTIGLVVNAEQPPFPVGPDSEMLDRARSLGLLPGISADTAQVGPETPANLKPVPPPAPRGKVLPFVVSGPGAESGTLSIARRKRWREERDTALGAQSRPSALGKSPSGMYARDIVSAALMTGSSDATHECLEAHFPMAAPAAAAGTCEKTLKGVLSSSFSTVCGMSGGRWKQLKHDQA